MLFIFGHSLYGAIVIQKKGETADLEMEMTILTTSVQKEKGLAKRVSTKASFSWKLHVAVQDCSVEFFQITVQKVQHKLG